jgi:hypothetical protein
MEVQEEFHSCDAAVVQAAIGWDDILCTSHHPLREIRDAFGLPTQVVDPETSRNQQK